MLCIGPLSARAILNEKKHQPLHADFLVRKKYSHRKSYWNCQLDFPISLPDFSTETRPKVWILPQNLGGTTTLSLQSNMAALCINFWRVTGMGCGDVRQAQLPPGSHSYHLAPQAVKTADWSTWKVYPGSLKEFFRMALLFPNRAMALFPCGCLWKIPPLQPESAYKGGKTYILTFKSSDP